MLAPRLTYAELGAWVQKATGAPVYVAPPIRDRKATVLVEDRPVRETMDRVADALFLVWEREAGGGYALRLRPEVAEGEKTMVRAEAEARLGALRRQMDALAEFGRYSPERTKAEIAEARDEVARLKKAGEPTEEAQERLSRLSTFDAMGHVRAAGSLLSQLSAGARGAILSGSTPVASNRGEKGFLRLPQEAVDALAKNDGAIKPDSRVLFSLRYEPMKGELWLVEKPIGGGGSATTLGGDLDVEARKRLADEPMTARMRDWAAQDAGLMATKVRPEKPQPEKPGPTPYRALSELLVDLHARTGLPIVADGFRVAVVARHPPEGADVKAWLGSLGNWTDARFRGYKPLVRAADGWLQMRMPRYWNQLAREIPESRVLPLEAAARRPGGAKLEDYAAFAGRLTPVEAPWTRGQDLVMEAPNKTLEGNVPFLRLWNALGGGMRGAATSPVGLSARSLSGPQRRLYDACFDDKRGSLFGTDDKLLDMWFGFAPMPSDLRLWVNPSASLNVLDTDDVRFWSYDSGRDGGVPGVQANLGTPENRGFAWFMVPLGRGVAVRPPRVAGGVD